MDLLAQLAPLALQDLLAQRVLPAQMEPLDLQAQQEQMELLDRQVPREPTVRLVLQGQPVLTALLAQPARPAQLAQRGRLARQERTGRLGLRELGLRVQRDRRVRRVPQGLQERARQGQPDLLELKDLRVQLVLQGRLGLQDRVE